ncbi:hypothetical protein [Nocardioides cavernaquae]|nr:hypothetical protein [Nocardioides cavernaquae]
MPDPLWGTECLAFNLQVDLDNYATAAVEEVLDVLYPGLPTQHLVPSTALHISVLNIIRARSPNSRREKVAQWDRHQEHWLAAIDATANETTPFEIDLTELLPASSGVVAVARNCPELVDLRRRLASSMGLDTGPVPELCHATVMRFGPVVPKLAGLTQILDDLAIRVTTQVTALRTVRELVYPSLVRETLREHPLEQST